MNTNQAQAEPTYEELKAQLAAAIAKNERKAGSTVTENGLNLRVGEKGGISVYGVGRFPVTLYSSQMLKFLDAADDIRAFIVANASKLATKPVKEEKTKAATK